ncbi:MAG: PilZ domain-containing protein [Thermodesulfobacteriota bacterium]
MADGKKKSNEHVVGDYVLLRPDRRKEVRRHLLVLRVCGENDNIFFGYAKNLSRGGLFIATVNPRKIGDEFVISFKLQDSGEKAVCRCRVTWVREYNPKTNSEPGMGIHFIDMEQEIKNKIEEWVKKG